MRKLEEFLSEREIFILENHPRTSYAKLGSMLGITGNRVAQIKCAALRKIRDEKKREAARERGRIKVSYELNRAECHLIIRALEHFATFLTPGNHKARNNPNYEKDPDIARCDALVERLRNVLAEQNNETSQE